MSKQNLKSAIRDHQKRTGSNYTTARREVLSDEHDTSPAPFIAQAASTTDPAVFQALEDIDLLKRYFYHLRAEFVERVTGEGKFYGSRSPFNSSPVPRLVSVDSPEKPKGEFGRWKQGPNGRGWVPAVNSKMEEEFEVLNKVPRVSIPGAEHVQGMLLGNYMVTPAIFALDGTIWLHFANDPEGHPDLREDDRIGSNWVRERNSSAMRAIEDRKERTGGMRTLHPLNDDEYERVEFLFAEERRREEERAEENRAFWAAHRAKHEGKASPF